MRGSSQKSDSIAVCPIKEDAPSLRWRLDTPSIVYLRLVVPLADAILMTQRELLMVALAWNLKAWFGLMLPVTGRWAEMHREQQRQVLVMEFKSFLSAFIRIPCQIVKSGRRLIYRLLGWNPHLQIFFRLLSVLNC